MTTRHQFLYRIRPVRPTMLVDGPTESEAAIVVEHFRYLQQLVDTGVVLLAGRTLNNDDKAFGIVIFTAASESDAMGIMRNDPAVAKRVMDAELFPYRIALWSRHGPDAGQNHT
jgi:uncharacterized protein YciI